MAMAAAAGGSLHGQPQPPTIPSTKPLSRSVAFADDGWNVKSGKGLAHADVHTYVVTPDACWLSDHDKRGKERQGLDLGCNIAHFKHQRSPSAMVGKKREAEKG